MIYANKTFDDLPGWLITEASDERLARTAIKIGTRNQLPVMRIEEKLNGEIQKYAYAKPIAN